MNKTGFRKSLIAAALVAALVLAGTGCKGKQLNSSEPSANASAQGTVDPMSFTAIDAKFRDYTFGINEFMREHSAEATQKKVTSALVRSSLSNRKFELGARK